MYQQVKLNQVLSMINNSVRTSDKAVWHKVYDGVFEKEVSDSEVTNAINSTVKWTSERLTVRLDAEGQIIKW